MVWGLSRDVSLSGDEAGFIRILGSENDWELFRCYPPSGPVDVWLDCREPGISQNDISISYVSQEETEADFRCPMVHVEVHVIAYLSFGIWSPIDVDDLPWGN